LTGRIYILSRELLQQITNTARPMMGQMFGVNKKQDVMKVYRQIFMISVGLAIVVSSAFFAGNADFVGWWVGGQNYGGIWLDAAFATNLVVHCWVLPNRAVLSSAMIVRPQTLSRIVEGILNLLLAVLFAQWWGVVGIVFSTAVAAVFTSMWYLPFLTARLFNRSFWLFFTKDWLLLILVALLSALTSYSSRYFFVMATGLLGAAMKFLIVFIIGSLLLWFIAFDNNIRDRLLSGVSLFGARLFSQKTKI
jgi:Na+-driven multidrug efflux pump